LTDFNGVEVELLAHASVKLENSVKIYIDPWSEVMDSYEKADIIVSTHDHFDHFDLDAIENLRKEDTVLICTEHSEDKVPEDMDYKIISSGTEVEVYGVKFRGVKAYNVDKYSEEGESFHPEGFCTGVVFELEDTAFYHLSDTDPIPDMREVSDVDVAFVPIGGKYTMDQEEALEAVEMIDPETVVPIHYNVVEGTEADPERFKDEAGVSVKIL